jgi:hypothetical protein
LVILLYLTTRDGQFQGVQTDFTDWFNCLQKDTRASLELEGIQIRLQMDGILDWIGIVHISSIFSFFPISAGFFTADVLISNISKHLLTGLTGLTGSKTAMLLESRLNTCFAGVPMMSHWGLMGRFVRKNKWTHYS